MKRISFQEKYPIFTLEIKKSECKFSTTNEILNFFQGKIKEHPIAHYIATFDHYTHTKNLPQGEIEDDMQNAKNIIFCFGKELPSPLVLAVRPRSIGIAEYEEKFIISFLETPNPQMTKMVEEWILSLKQ